MSAEADTVPTFAALLYRYRLGATLTQEALAERAGMSTEQAIAYALGGAELPDGYHHQALS